MEFAMLSSRLLSGVYPKYEAEIPKYTISYAIIIANELNSLDWEWFLSVSFAAL